jgi:hypothetical protein
MTLVDLPGSAGEHEVQRRYGTSERAERFYAQQMLDRLNERRSGSRGRSTGATASSRAWAT